MAWGRSSARYASWGVWIDRASRLALAAAINTNLSVLVHYKYANFFIGSVNTVAGARVSLAEIVLSIGISFFTFTQTAYLVDT